VSDGTEPLHLKHGRTSTSASLLTYSCIATPLRPRLGQNNCAGVGAIGRILRGGPGKGSTRGEGCARGLGQRVTKRVSAHHYNTCHLIIIIIRALGRVRGQGLRKGFLPNSLRYLLPQISVRLFCLFPQSYNLQVCETKADPK